MTFLLVLTLWIFSLCLHEYAHARVAYEGGDISVVDKGYLSLNPLRYTNPMFSLLMPLLFLCLGGIGLPGGAVYIEHWRLRSRHWESAVSVAGPLANLLLAVLLGLVFRIAPVSADGPWPALAFVGLLQVCATVLNLIPVPPLDGYGIIAPYLSPSMRETMDQARGWALWVLIAVLWYSDAVNGAFWGLVFRIAAFLGVPIDLALQGLRDFRFWRQ